MKKLIISIVLLCLVMGVFADENDGLEISSTWLYDTEYGDIHALPSVSFSLRPDLDRSFTLYAEPGYYYNVTDPWGDFTDYLLESLEADIFLRLPLSYNNAVSNLPLSSMYVDGYVDLDYMYADASVGLSWLRPDKDAGFYRTQLSDDLSYPFIWEGSSTYIGSTSTVEMDYEYEEYWGNENLALGSYYGRRLGDAAFMHNIAAVEADVSYDMLSGAAVYPLLVDLIEVTAATDDTGYLQLTLLGLLFFDDLLDYDMSTMLSTTQLSLAADIRFEKSFDKLSVNGQLSGSTYTVLDAMSDLQNLENLNVYAIARIDYEIVQDLSLSLYARKYDLIAYLLGDDDLTSSLYLTAGFEKVFADWFSLGLTVDVPIDSDYLKGTTTIHLL